CMFFANAAARSFFGLAAGDPAPPLGPTDYLETSEDQLLDIEHTLGARNQWSGELTARNPEGKTIPVEVVVVAHRDDNGAIEYYRARARDRSEGRKSEDARRRRERVLRAFVEGPPLAIFAFDRGGVVHVGTHAAEELFGWLATGVVGRQPPFVTAETRGEF